MDTLTHRFRTRLPGLRQFLPGLAAIFAFVLPPLVVGAAGMGLRLMDLGAGAPPPFAPALSAPPTHDPSKPTAVVIASNRGTEIIDFLPPYEILAASGAFNVYAVAPERTVSPISTSLHVPSGLDFVPHFSFAEYDRLIGTDPDLIVVPALSGYDASTDAPTVAWIHDHAGERTTILTICAGTRPLVDAGLLDGHAATTFHRSIPDFAVRYPSVRWVRGVRFVDDGRVISSSSLSSGIDATLHTVERLVGRDAAEDVARRLGYPHTRFLDEPAYTPPARIALAAIPNAAYRWSLPDLGLVLYDGVDEFALASIIDAYGSSAAAQFHTVAPERTVIRSRHGLALVPRHDFRSAPGLDRVLVPGAPADAAAVPALGEWARQQQLSVDYLLDGDPAGGSAYDAALRDLAREQGRAVALAAATNLVYPTEHLNLDGPAWPYDILARPLLIGVVGVGLALGAARARAARRAPVPASTARPVSVPT